MTSKPRTRRLLYDLDPAGRGVGPQVLAAPSKILDPKVGNGEFSFIAEGPANTRGVARGRLAHASRSVTIEVKPGEPTEDSGSAGPWDPTTRTQWVRFPNAPDGRRIGFDGL